MQKSLLRNPEAWIRNMRKISTRQQSRSISICARPWTRSMVEFHHNTTAMLMRRGVRWEVAERETIRNLSSQITTENAIVSSDNLELVTIIERFSALYGSKRRTGRPVAIANPTSSESSTLLRISDLRASGVTTHSVRHERIFFFR